MMETHTDTRSDTFVPMSHEERMKRKRLRQRGWAMNRARELGLLVDDHESLKYSDCHYNMIPSSDPVGPNYCIKMRPPVALPWPPHTRGIVSNDRSSVAVCEGVAEGTCPE
jgi:hypothetical protein